MSGQGKRASAACSTEAGCEQPSASKQQKTEAADWCADCWAAPSDACLGGHWLVDTDTAEKDAQAKLALLRREEAWVQTRLAALAEARALTAPVLKAHVRSVDQGDDDSFGWFVDGGDVRIALAVNKSLSAEDRRAICEALNHLRVDYVTDKTESVMVYGVLGARGVAAMQGVLPKLADCPEGQAVRRGAVLLVGGRRLEVHFRDTCGRHGAKLFGQVQSGLAQMEGHGCDPRTCRGLDMECYCVSGHAGGTNLSRVEFVA